MLHHPPHNIPDRLRLLVDQADGGEDSSRPVDLIVVLFELEPERGIDLHNELKNYLETITRVLSLGMEDQKSSGQSEPPAVVDWSAP